MPVSKENESRPFLSSAGFGAKQIDVLALALSQPHRNVVLSAATIVEL